MAVLVLCYEKCSTCKKALDWLCAQGVSYTVRDIVGERPNEAELTQWITESHLPVKRFFNTSGLKYKALGLKSCAGQWFYGDRSSGNSGFRV